jgi:hypothetical protein
MRFLRGLLRDLIQQLPLPLHILLRLLITQLVESVHVAQVLVHVLELSVGQRFF